MTKHLESQPATTAHQEVSEDNPSSSALPPKGWDYFGTNIDHRGHLEFSEARDSAGDPLWERPLHGRNTLIRLASRLDEARRAANTIPEMTGSPDVRELINRALESTLTLITSDQATTDAVYHELVADGLSVRRALDNAETRRKGRVRS